MDVSSEMDLGPLFDTPQIRSIDTSDGVRHEDAAGREYDAVTVGGELTFELRREKAGNGG